MTNWITGIGNCDYYMGGVKNSVKKELSGGGKLPPPPDGWNWVWTKQLIQNQIHFVERLKLYNASSQADEIPSGFMNLRSKFGWSSSSTICFIGTWKAEVPFVTALYFPYQRKKKIQPEHLDFSEVLPLSYFLQLFWLHCLAESSFNSPRRWVFFTALWPPSHFKSRKEEPFATQE